MICGSSFTNCPPTARMSIGNSSRFAFADHWPRSRRRRLEFFDRGGARFPSYEYHSPKTQVTVTLSILVPLSDVSLTGRTHVAHTHMGRNRFHRLTDLCRRFVRH